VLPEPLIRFPRLGTVTGAAYHPPVPQTRAAATVVLLTDSDEGPRVLLTRRDGGMEFMGGFWVFPGGSVEPADGDAGTVDAARHAAVRETEEEVGLVVDAPDLIEWSHWEPPPDYERRFATWFFVGRAPAGDVVLDEREARAYAWWRPADVLAARDRGEVKLAPPTWVTLHDLARFRRVDDILDFARTTEAEFFMTKLRTVDGGHIAMWEGDIAYVDDDALHREGGRRRLWMLESGWSYERTS